MHPRTCWHLVVELVAGPFSMNAPRAQRGGA
jgi:hypothetical protein